MMKKYKWWLTIFNLILVLFLFNRSICEKEQILEDGTLVLLKLAPVDPRSLMQGDYMRLRYEIAQTMRFEEKAKSGYIVIKIDENGVGSKVRIQNDFEPLTAGEYAIGYNIGMMGSNIGSKSFFFEEGQGEKYQSAEFGGLKVDKLGNSILVGLYDKDLKKIE